MSAARLFAVAAVVALALAAVPLGAADHAYSHRFVLEGRVVDEDGLPLPNRTVEFFSVGGSFPAPCEGGHSPVTNVEGDFRFCFHVHELEASTRVGVRVGNATVEKAMDTAFRRSVVTVVVENETGEAPERWDRTYRVSGKVWRPGATIVEGVPVFGTALAGVPVNVSLLSAQGDVMRGTLVTDSYGDFDATYELVEGTDAAEVELVLESMGSMQRRPLEVFAHRHTVGFLLPPERVPLEVGGQPPVTTQFPGEDAAVSEADAPGARAPEVPAALFIGIALAAIATIVVRKRRG